MMTFLFTHTRLSRFFGFLPKNLKAIVLVPFIAILLLFTPLVLHSQQIEPATAVGLPQTAFDGTDVEHVDLMSGALQVNIPLIAMPGRGINTDIGLSYSSKLWFTTTATEDNGEDWYNTAYFVNAFAAQPLTSPEYSHLQWGEISSGWFLGFPRMGYISGYQQEQWSGLPTWTLDTETWQNLDGSSIGFTQSNGMFYTGEISGCSQYCSPPLPTTCLMYNGQPCQIGPFWSYDDTYTVNYDTGSPLYPRYVNAYKDGVTATASLNQYLDVSDYILGLEDTNGNTIKCAYGTCTDTIGRTFTLSPNTSGMAATLSYLDSTRSSRQVSISYTQYVLNYPFVETIGCVSQLQGGSFTDGCTYGYVGSTSLPTLLTLPNGATYKFEYAMNADGTSTGELSKLTLPGGGYIRYQYGFSPNNPYAELCINMPNCSQRGENRVVTDRYVSPDGLTGSEQHWSYLIRQPYTLADGPNAGTPVVSSIVTKPTGEQKLEIFQDSDALSQSLLPVIPEIVREKELDASGNALSIVDNLVGYDNSTYNVWDYALPGWYPYNNPRITNSTQTLPDTAQKSSTQYSFGTYGNISQIANYDWTATGNDALLSRTVNTFLVDSTTSAYGPQLSHILDRVSSTTIYDSTSNTCNGSSSFCSKWTYGYDEFPVQATTGVVSHDYNEYSGIGAPNEGNLTSVRRWLDSGTYLSTQHYYNDLGKPVQVTDSNGQSTYYSYNDSFVNNFTPVQPALAFVTRATLPQTGVVSHIHQYQYYFDIGKLSAACGENFSGGSCQAGMATNASDYQSLTYDRLDRIRCVQSGDGGSTCLSYVDTAPLSATETKIQTPDPTVTRTTTFDGLGRGSIVTTDSDPEGVVATAITYNSLGQKYSVTSPKRSIPASTDGTTVFNTYDALGRLRRETLPDGNTLSWVYSGNSSASTDERGNSWVRWNDALGRLTKVQEPGGLITNYSYDALGDLVGVNQLGRPNFTPVGFTTPEVSKTRMFSYDALARLLQACNPESLPAGQACDGSHWSTLYGYDANSNLLNKTDANGTVVNYSYDALNRLLTKTSPNDGELKQQFTYDQGPNGIGRLTQVYDPLWPGYIENGTQFSYDPLGRLNATNWFDYAAQSWKPGPSAVYDLAGNVAQLTYPDQQTIISQTWDAAGRLSGVYNGPLTQPGSPYISGIQYTPSGQMTSATYGNGATESVSFNSRLQPCRQTANTTLLPSVSGMPNLLNRELFYEQPREIVCGVATANNGNVWSILEGPNLGTSQSFGYDPLNRLTQAMSGNRPLSNSYSFLYYPDSFGNMIPADQLHAPMNYGVDSATNRMTLNGSLTTGDLRYYPNGNLYSSPDGLGNYHTFAYTAEGYIRSIDNYQTGSYLTDGLGQRTLAVHDGHQPTWWDEYIYFNGQPAATWSVDRLTNAYSYTNFIYANGKKIAKVQSADTRVHLTATANATNDAARWTVGILPFPAVTFQPGDVLNFRMYQHNMSGYIGLVFSDGSNSDWYCYPCRHPDSVQDQWASVSIPIGGPVGSPGPMTGKTLSYFFAGEAQQPNLGEFDVMIADIVLTRADGSILPFPVPLGPVPYGGDLTDETNASCVSETVSNTSGAIGAISDTNYYLADQVGTTQLELSSGGWPVWQGWFTPFGQEIVNGGEQNLIGQVPQDGTNNRYKFTGKERDAESGLDYFEARYYESSMGRFVLPDPIMVNTLRLVNPQRWNLYSYAVNNPITFADPDGRDAISVNFTNDVGGLGHFGIISLHSNGTATYSRFGPASPGSPMGKGRVQTDINLPKVQFGSDGKPTDASIKEVTQAVSNFEEYTGPVFLSYFKTSESETAALDDYINRVQAESDRGNLEYLGPFSTCATYCARGLYVAGRKSAGLHFGMVPNLYAGRLWDLSDQNYQERVTDNKPREKVTVTIVDWHLR